jgi:hypothetical protein
MQSEICLHPFILPDDKLVEKLKARAFNGDLFIFNNLEMACQKHYMLCFGWVNFVNYENGIVTFICRVIEDTEKLLAIHYTTVDGEKEIESLYLV